MTSYIAAALAVALAGAVAWGAWGHLRLERQEAALRAAQALAEAAEQRAALARFNHQIAVEALQEVKAERDAIAARFDQWRKTHADTLDRPADPALLDLIDSLRPGASGGAARTD